MFERAKRDIAEKTVEENLDALVRFAFFRLRDMAEAEDVVQEAVLKFLESRHRIMRSESSRSYLFRIVYNLCQDTLREAGREVPLDSIDESGCGVSEEERLDREEAGRINRLLSGLPERESEVIRMNVVDELSFAEISRILDIPASTVKSRFKSGMDRLRESYN